MMMSLDLRGRTTWVISNGNAIWQFIGNVASWSFQGTQIAARVRASLLACRASVSLGTARRAIGQAVVKTRSDLVVTHKPDKAQVYRLGPVPLVGGVVVTSLPSGFCCRIRTLVNSASALQDARLIALLRLLSGLSDRISRIWRKRGSAAASRDLTDSIQRQPHPHAVAAACTCTLHSTHSAPQSPSTRRKRWQP